MWYLATIGGGTAAAVAMLAYRYHKPDPGNTAALEPLERIETCETVEQLVSVLQNIGGQASIEELTTLLSASLETHGVTEACLEKLSSMHKVHGADMGLCGYAINFVWATILEGIVGGRVVILS
tara:strand:+ start:632 stop:1003 length:372 start_codon:yes stop_codon:yes gene_type:complete